MSKTTKHPGREAPGGEERSGRPFLRRLAAFFLILALTLALVLAAAWRDGTGFDALRRYFSYAGPLSGRLLRYEYEADPSSRFAWVGDGSLLILSDTAAQLLGPDGNHHWSAAVQMTNPTLHSGGGRTVAYDVGGRSLYVLDEEGQVLALTTEGALISARLNGLGMLAVTESASSGKGAVSVYDAQMELAFVFTSQRRFVADACVTEDGKYLAAATLGQEESAFVSSVVLYRLTEKNPAGSFPVEDGLVLSMKGQGEGSILAAADTCLAVGSVEGRLLAVYSYRGAYLREFDLAGDGYAALLLGRYASGSQARLVTVSQEGEEIASLEIGEEVRHISACGRYVSVLYTDRCVVYNQELEVYATARDAEAVRQVLTREDGSVLLIAADHARVFLP